MNEDLGTLVRAGERASKAPPPSAPGRSSRSCPSACFAFAWKGETVRFEIAPDGDGSRLRFTHVFDPDRAQASRNAAGWHFCLEALGASLSGPPDPSPTRQKELTDRYIAALGEGPTADN